AQVTAGMVDQAPAGGLEVDREVDQQRGAAADDVGAGPAGRELREVGDVRRLAELAERGACGVRDVRAGPRPDAGGTTRLGHEYGHAGSLRNKVTPGAGARGRQPRGR